MPVDRSFDNHIAPLQLCLWRQHLDSHDSQDQLTCVELKVAPEFEHCDQYFVQSKMAHTCCRRVCTAVRASTVVALKCFDFDSSNVVLGSWRVDAVVELKQHSAVCCKSAENCQPSLVAEVSRDYLSCPCSVGFVADKLHFAGPFEALVLPKVLE